MAMPEITHIPSLSGTDLRLWLEQTATIYGCTYLFAHADDGVIWGRFDAGTLITSHDVFGALHCPATIRTTTLWEARLFGVNAEVLLWRVDGIWRARVIHDATLSPHDDYLIEQQMLWGDHAESHAEGFTLLVDGSEGLRHAVPIMVPDTAFIDTRDKEQQRRLRPVRLRVHHFIDFDDAGNARIALSRLVDLMGGAI